MNIGTNSSFITYSRIKNGRDENRKRIFRFDFASCPRQKSKLPTQAFFSSLVHFTMNDARYGAAEVSLGVLLCFFSILLERQTHSRGGYRRWGNKREADSAILLGVRWEGWVVSASAFLFNENDIAKKINRQCDAGTVCGCGKCGGRAQCRGPQ